MNYRVRVKSVSIAEYAIEANNEDDARTDYEMGELIEVEPCEETIISIKESH